MPRRPAPPYYLRRRPCYRACTDGRPCALDNDPQHPHQHCICGDPLCICHSPAAYGLDRIVVRGVAQYRRSRGIKYLEVT